LSLQRHDHIRLELPPTLLSLTFKCHNLFANLKLRSIPGA
jgi:hypothetical protein